MNLRPLALFAAASFGAWLGLAAGAASAADDVKHPETQPWSFNGVFGTFDRAQLQRGFLVYKDVCASCHALKYVSFLDLIGIGFTDPEAKAIAEGYQVTDGPNEEGEMFQRAGRLADRLPAPYANDNAARASNGGALPPNLSLITKARHDGSNYLFALLTGYGPPPAGVTVGEGLHYNPYFPGGQIAMPPPLNANQVQYGDGTEATVKQMAQDVTAFLSWAAEPKLEARKRLGFKVVIFLIVLTGLFILAKQRVWRTLH